jgi:hypothetical protein
MLRGSATGRQAAVSIYGSADPALGQRRYQ